MDTSISIATQAFGGAWHLIGSRIASIVTDYTPFSAALIPTAGPLDFADDLSAGNYDLGTMASVDAYYAYSGLGDYLKPYTNLRNTLWGNKGITLNWVVREDSDIFKVADLRGQTVAGVYEGDKIVTNYLLASMQPVGLSWDDVTIVPVPDYLTGMRLLQDGKVNAAFGGATVSSRVIEVDAAIGVRVLPFADLTPEEIKDGVPGNVQAAIDQLLPTVVIKVAQAGDGIVKEGTVLHSILYNIVSSTNTLPGTVYKVLEAVWENHEKLDQGHHKMTGGPEVMLSTVQSIPYHEGAVEFYKKKGIWTDAHQVLQDSFF